MAITSAVQRGNSVNVFNDKGALIFSQVGELVGYTQTTASIKKGKTVYEYNEKGGVVRSHNC